MNTKIVLNTPLKINLVNILKSRMHVSKGKFAGIVMPEVAFPVFLPTDSIQQLSSGSAFEIPFIVQLLKAMG